MKKSLLLGLGAVAMVAFGCSFAALSNVVETKEASAEVVSTGFKGGETFFVVDQIGAFATTDDGDGQLRAYFLNSDDTCDYLADCIYTSVTTRETKPVYRIVAPNYTAVDGGSWTKLILLRYNVANKSDTEVDWDHRHNQSYDIDLTSFNGSYNTIYVYGWVSDTVYFNTSWGNVTDYCGPTSGTKMYAEPGSWDQGDRTGLFAIYFKGAVDGASYNASITLTSSLMVLGRGGEYTKGLWEFTVPKSSSGDVVTWHTYNFVELKAGYDTLVWNETNLYQSSDINFSYHNVIKGGNSADYSVTDSKRVGYFSTYFLAETGAVCDDDGATSAAALATAWSKVGAQYPIVNSAALPFGGATGNEEGTVLEQAVARYDYIIKKYNTKTVTVYEDFAKRVSAGKITLSGLKSAPALVDQKLSGPVLIISVALPVALLSIAGYFVMKRGFKKAD